MDDLLRATKKEFGKYLIGDKEFEKGTELLKQYLYWGIKEETKRRSDFTNEAEIDTIVRKKLKSFLREFSDLKKITQKSALDVNNWIIKVSKEKHDPIKHPNIGDIDFPKRDGYDFTISIYLKGE